MSQYDIYEILKAEEGRKFTVSELSIILNCNHSSITRNISRIRDKNIKKSYVDGKIYISFDSC